MIKEDFQKIRLSEKFKAIIGRSILVSCFLNDDLSKKLWEYNFLSEDNKTTYTFIVDGEVILKDSGTLLSNKNSHEELQLLNLKLEEKEIIAITHYELMRTYKEDRLSKLIISIESSNKNINWNITTVLKNLKIINIKINDKTSQMIESREVIPFSPLNQNAYK